MFQCKVKSNSKAVLARWRATVAWTVAPAHLHTGWQRATVVQARLYMHGCTWQEIVEYMHTGRMENVGCIKEVIWMVSDGYMQGMMSDGCMCRQYREWRLYVQGDAEWRLYVQAGWWVTVACAGRGGGGDEWRLYVQAGWWVTVVCAGTMVSDGCMWRRDGEWRLYMQAGWRVMVVCDGCMCRRDGEWRLYVTVVCAGGMVSDGCMCRRDGE